MHAQFDTHHKSKISGALSRPYIQYGYKASSRLDINNKRMQTAMKNEPFVDEKIDAEDSLLVRHYSPRNRCCGSPTICHPFLLISQAAPRKLRKEKGTKVWPARAPKEEGNKL
ncbi:hypothetical protein OUZ56_000710 [Daphnia magna]|uniref:Uncharacterized protein n=1 Tax=Daphnia magna TaxID=35525 RepID=A0ABR0A0K4_9CRUS|nr:hypothetical protein OUZ56_000710 [Daphnia magna]